MTLLVLGASGFLGNQLVAQLRNSGKDVIGTKRTVLSQEGLFQVDLGVHHEHEKIDFLIKKFKVTHLINMAASDVNPSGRRETENGESALFFENLNTVLGINKDVRLLHIGTSALNKKEDSYFATKQQLKKLFAETATRSQIAVLDLPKVVGPGEPLGRFTSNFMQALINGEKQIVLHPCHKRNFMAVASVVKMIMQIITTWKSGGSEFPEYKAQVLSNYEITRLVLKLSGEDFRKVLFGHTLSNTGCDICPSNEAALLVRPEFFDLKEIKYFAMAEKQSVQESLLEQYRDLSIKLINSKRDGCN